MCLIVCLYICIAAVVYISVLLLLFIYLYCCCCLCICIAAVVYISVLLLLFMYLYCCCCLYICIAAVVCISVLLLFEFQLSNEEGLRSHYPVLHRHISVSTPSYDFDFHRRMSNGGRGSMICRERYLIFCSFLCRLGSIVDTCGPLSTVLHRRTFVHP